MAFLHLRKSAKGRSRETSWRHMASRCRLLRFDVLESRHMLAANAFSPWQNPANPFDVNDDGAVTNKDAHRLIDELRAMEPACLAAPTNPTARYWDVSGDGTLSVDDVELVIRSLTDTLPILPPRTAASVAPSESADTGGGGDGRGMSLLSSFTLTLDDPSGVQEGQAFALTGTISPPGSYYMEVTIESDYSIWPGGGTYTTSVQTEPDGTFAVGLLIPDDGVSGTASDVHTFDVSAVFDEGSADDSTTVTVSNVAPIIFEPEVRNFWPTGGPHWEVVGEIQDEALYDSFTVTIDWGDDTPPTVITDQGFVNPFFDSHTYPPTGETYIVTVTVVDDDGGTAVWSGPAPMYLLDLDNDANNDETIEASDDPLESTLPGRYIWVNSDDDDVDEIVDLVDVGPIANENELEEFQLDFVAAIRPEINNYYGWHLTLSFDPNNTAGGSVWETADKTGLVEFEENFDFGIFCKTWVVGVDTLPSSLYLEAANVGRIALKLELWDSYFNPVDGDWIVFTAIKASVDLDTDSDNTNVVERSALEEADELKAPGNIIQRNWDDDNLNGVPDYSDAGPLIDPIGGGPLWDNDIELLNFSVDAAGIDLTGYTITYSTDSALIKLWKEPDKEPLLPVYTIGTNPIPPTLYVEGIDCGQFKVYATLSAPDGTVVHRDVVLITVVTIDAVAYRQQTAPFTLVPIAPPHVSAAVAEATENNGVGIRRNGDDDDENGSADRGDLIAYSSENDLIRVDLNRQPNPASGVGYKVSRSDTDIRAFGSADKTSTLLWSAMEAAVSWQNTVWVEWVSTGGGTSTLEFSLWDATHNRKVFFDQVVFKPFNSVVVVFNGEFETASDPPESGSGMNVFAHQEYYESGLDVLLYDEDEVAIDGSGAAYDAVVSAIQTRGVTDVAIMGYSHGGGSTYHLAWRLQQNTIIGSGIADITSPFMIPFTGYVDAIRNTSDVDDWPEDRRPPLSIFHCGQYQRNWHMYPFVIGSSSGGNDDIDRSYLGESHFTVDDNIVVLGHLSMRLRQKVLP